MFVNALLGKYAKYPAVVGIAALALVTGCSDDTTQSDDVDIANAADAARGSVDRYHALPDEKSAVRPATMPPRASPTATPMPDASKPAPEPESGTDPETPIAAAAVVERYYSLIGAGRYAEAWKLWDHDGRASGMSERAFAESFARYADYTGEVGPAGRVDAGAGQRYVTVAVRVSGRLKDGNQAFAMAGPVTLHRVADVDGASAAQRQWRISTSGVRPPGR